MFTRSDLQPIFWSLIVVIAAAMFGATHRPHLVPIAHAAAPVTPVHSHYTPTTLPVGHKGCQQHWTITPDSPEYEAYKNARLVEYEDILCDLGVKKSADLKLFASQLMVENGALSETVIGDHGCSLGIPQYNACAHNHESAKAFLNEHPEWQSYKYQLKWMALAMMDKYDRFADVRRAIIAHNSPAAAARDQDNGYFATVLKKSSMLTL